MAVEKVSKEYYKCDRCGEVILHFEGNRKVNDTSDWVIDKNGNVLCPICVDLHDRLFQLFMDNKLDMESIMESTENHVVVESEDVEIEDDNEDSVKEEFAEETVNDFRQRLKNKLKGE